MNNYSKIVSYVIVAIVLYFSFSIHILLGIAAILAIIGYLIYSKRDAMITQRAVMENNNGNRQLALGLLDQAYKINPNNPATLSNYAYLCLKDGQIEKSEKLMNELISNKSITAPMRASIEMTRSLIVWKQGNLEEAIHMLEALHEKMKTTVLYGSLGYFYIEQGDLDRALDYNLEALDYNDTDAIILDNLLLTHILREEWDQAEQIGTKLSELNPKFPEAFYHLGLLKLHKEDVEGAIESFQHALDRPFTAVSTENRETIEQKLQEVREQYGIQEESDEVEESSEAEEADGVTESK